MTSIQISDLNVSDFEFMHQLTDEELLEINGGGFWGKVVGGIVGGFIGYKTGGISGVINGVQLGAELGSKLEDKIRYA